MKEYFLNCERFWRDKDPKSADMYAFLATLDREDFGLLFDTSVFNDIASAYLQVALSEAIEDNVLTEEQARSVLLYHGKKLDVLSSEEALKKASHIYL